MKTYRVKATFTFSGEFYVRADNKEDAKQIVSDECGMTFGSITTVAEWDRAVIIDWDFDMIPEKKISSITLKPKNKKQK